MCPVVVYIMHIVIERETDTCMYTYIHRSAGVYFCCISIALNMCLAFSCPQTAGYSFMHLLRFHRRLHLSEHRVLSVSGQLNLNQIRIHVTLVGATKSIRLNTRSKNRDA